MEVPNPGEPATAHVRREEPVLDGEPKRADLWADGAAGCAREHTSTHVHSRGLDAGQLWCAAVSARAEVVRPTAGGASERCVPPGVPYGHTRHVARRCVQASSRVRVVSTDAVIVDVVVRAVVVERRVAVVMVVYGHDGCVRLCCEWHRPEAGPLLEEQQAVVQVQLVRVASGPGVVHCGSPHSETTRHLPVELVDIEVLHSANRNVCRRIEVPGMVRETVSSGKDHVVAHQHTAAHQVAGAHPGPYHDRQPLGRGERIGVRMFRHRAVLDVVVECPSARALGDVESRQLEFVRLSCRWVVLDPRDVTVCRDGRRGRIRHNGAHVDVDGGPEPAGGVDGAKP